MRVIGLATLLLFAPSLCAGTWTVDDNGPADFSSIQAAIEALPEGETILVQPGKYDAFILEKRMQIFGLLWLPRPRVMDRSAVDGAPSFTIAGLRMDALTVSGVAGRGSIEDCELVGLPSTGGFEPDGSLDVTGCQQLLIARTTMSGFDSGVQYVTAGLELNASTVVVVDCTVRGGDGLVAPLGRCGVWGSMSAAVYSGSHFVGVQSSFRGGDGGVPTTFSQCGGNGGLGMWIEASFVELLSCDVVPGTPDFNYLGAPALPLYVSAGTVVSPPIAGTFVKGGVQINPPYTLPTVSIELTVAPSGATGLSLGGPTGEPGLLVAALDADVAELGHYEGLLWVLPKPTLLVPFVTPQVFHFTIPPTPALSGTTFTLQAVYPGLPGVLHPAKVMTSNPDQLVIRY